MSEGGGPEADRLVQLFGAAEVVGENAHASIYGPNLSQWPARMVDAALIVANCDAERRAAHDAMLRSRRRD